MKTKWLESSALLRNTLSTEAKKKLHHISPLFITCLNCRRTKPHTTHTVERMLHLFDRIRWKKKLPRNWALLFVFNVYRMNEWFCLKWNVYTSIAPPPFLFFECLNHTRLLVWRILITPKRYEYRQMIKNKEFQLKQVIFFFYEKY